MVKKSNVVLRPGAKVRMFNVMGSFHIQIARKSGKPFSDHIISVCIPEAITPISIDGGHDILTDAWIMVADGRRRKV